MPSHDACAVYGCDNKKQYPDRYVVMDHVKTLKFHGCNEKNFNKWEKLINRADFQVTKHTKICSNHFSGGQPFPCDPHPTLYLKGYTMTTPGRKSPKKRMSSSTDPGKKRARKYIIPTREISYDVHLSTPPPSKDHDSLTSVTCCCDSSSCLQCAQKLISQLQTQLHEAENTNRQLKVQHCIQEKEVHEMKMLQQSSKKLTLSDLEHSDNAVKIYTGIPSYKLFLWLVEQVRPAGSQMHYFKGQQSLGVKYYQKHDHAEKPGPKRFLSLEDELLLTLMKIRLNLCEEDLAFRFTVSASTVSMILSTWIPFLAKEMESWIVWPTKEEIRRYYPACFHKYKETVVSIIDCTEVATERPSMAKSNTQIFSSYKGRPTIKCLVGITPGGTVSYLSKCAGGAISDKELVQRSGILGKFNPGDAVLADRGFNIQDLLLEHQVKLYIPPFTKARESSTSQFTPMQESMTKMVANSRIHVERVIGRMKEFRILQGPVSLSMIDLMDSVMVICGGLTNLQPIMVPLQ